MNLLLFFAEHHSIRGIGIAKVGFGDALFPIGSAFGPTKIIKGSTPDDLIKPSQRFVGLDRLRRELNECFLNTVVG